MLHPSLSGSATPRDQREAVDLTSDEFRTLGHDLVERIAAFLDRLPSLLVTPGESPEAVRALLPDGGLPEQGAEPGALLAETAEMLFAHSLFNGHPRFFGYITSSPAPLGMLAEALAQRIAATPELQLVTRELSIATFRYMPSDLTAGASPAVDAYLDRLNMALLERLQQGGEVFVSNAVLGDRFLLRACIVNFRTTMADIEVLPEIVVRHGRALDAKLRSESA